MIDKLEKLFAKLAGGTSTDRFLKYATRIVEDINEIDKSYQELTDDELKAKTQEFKYRLKIGEELDDLLPEAFACVKDTCRRLIGTKWVVRGQEIEWNMIPYDVQIIGAIALHEGKIAEMATGEGKTLAATMPLYLNALTGQGAHLITVNDYLAQRDCEWMGKIYEFLGLRPAALDNDMSPEEKRDAYNADITYGTNNEFGFDYLRDNMSVDVWSVVQRPLHYAIIDEVDSVLVDESRTPLIISGSVGAPRNVYYELKPMVANLYKKQKELVDRLVNEGKNLLETDEEAAGLTLLRAQRGDPKNPALLQLLTSEFYVKKLIERIQGQYEINKKMSDVDSELYYTIDEKSNVVDITEKGRIFLSGGREQDTANKIQLLDVLDDRLAALSEKKNPAQYFEQDAVLGYCNNISFNGKLFLAGVKSENITENDLNALEKLAMNIKTFSGQIDALVQERKMDKTSARHHYFQYAKKMDGIITGLTDAGKKFLLKGEDDSHYRELVNDLNRLFDIISRDLESTNRSDQTRVKNLMDSFFVISGQTGAIVELKEEGKIAILAMKGDGDIQILPFITKISAMLNSSMESMDSSTSAAAMVEKTKEYFELSDSGTFVKHITEKGRIALLGGNPDLYVLPDRTNVEDMDRELQALLDKTLNQSNYDYVGKVVAVEDLISDLKNLGEYLVDFSEESKEKEIRNYYQIIKDYDQEKLKFTDRLVAYLNNYAEQLDSMLLNLNEALGKNQDSPEQIFNINNKGFIEGLNSTLFDQLLGISYQEAKKKINNWQKENKFKDEKNIFRLRKDLDDYLGEQGLGKKIEQLERINNILEHVFDRLMKTDMTNLEKRRLLERYFETSQSPAFDGNTPPNYHIIGLAETGMEILAGNAKNRLYVTDRLVELVEEPDTDYQAIFDMHSDGIPVDIKKIALSHLVDGLPFFSYKQELEMFREEVLKISSKKVSSRSDLEGLLPREKAHLRSKEIMLDEREMNELLVRAHAPSIVLSAEEIEHWCQTYFQRKPERVLQDKRDGYWRGYNEVEERIQNISQLLKAYTLFHIDVDYVVKRLDEGDMRRHGQQGRGKKAVVIVDQFTGRLMPGRRFSEGLHEALEAKEGVEVQAESQTLATITIQNFFRLYEKLAGMTGTAETESQEFFSTYKLDVVVIPTNRPVIREDFNDVIYRTKKEKYDAIIEEAVSMHEQGRPVLIGTVSVDVSQRLSDLFTRRGIPIANWLKKGDVNKELESGRFHTVLNAKYHKREADIISKAGLPGSITIATNMAGRGTDIKLHPDVVKKGGLHIIGSEKHEARRIDRQLRGRSGRQGDPGSSRFYLSLEDDLMRLFGSDRITNIMSKLGPSESGERIEHPLITRSIERAQKKVEERNFEIRKNLLEYDDVLNEQRKIIYKRRQNLLGFAQPEDFVESKSKRFFNEEDDPSKWQLEELIKDFTAFFRQNPDFSVDDLRALKHNEAKERVTEWVDKKLAEENHLQEMQIRHRIMGYCPPVSIVKELVHLKIKLHNAASQDIQKWNLEGIQYEMERIFNEKPDFPENYSDPQEIENKLVQWATDFYEKQTSKNQDTVQFILFKQLDLQAFLNVFIIGLMNRFLRPTQPPVSWETEEFFRGLERIFFARPGIGSNEIRTIRREKLLQILIDWKDELNIAEHDDMAYRNRVLGYLSPFYFVSAIIEYGFRRIENGNGRNINQLSPEQNEFFSSVFGDIFNDLSTETDSSEFLERLVEKAQKSFLSGLLGQMSGYNAIMLANTTLDEFIHASINYKTHAIIDKRDDAKKQLSMEMDFMFLNRPDKVLPDNQNPSIIEAFKEDLVAWALNLNQKYSYHEERIREERLSSEIVRDSIYGMIDENVYAMINQVLGDSQVLDPEMIGRLKTDCRLVFRQIPHIEQGASESLEPGYVMNTLSQWAQSLYKKRVEQLGSQLATRYERYYVLEKIDENWRQHLSGIDELREGIGLRGYGQKDPLLEYKAEAYKMFVQTIDRINRNVVNTLFKVFDVGGEIEEREMRRQEPQNYVTTHSQVELFKQLTTSGQKQQAQQPATRKKPKPVVKTARVGRNEPCPCGSGKKYKHCCGRNV